MIISKKEKAGTTITAQQDPETGVIALKRGDLVLKCPYRAPMIVPGQISGTVGIAESACNSSCPHFQIEPRSITLKCAPINTIINVSIGFSE
jgi:hypothetical protein